MYRSPRLSLAEPRGGFRHEAFLYADEDQFLAGTSSFVRDGLAADEPTLVVLEARKIEALRAELNGGEDRVLFADMAEVGRNPARIIPAWRQFVDRYARKGTALRGIGEPIHAKRGPAELVECQRHESLLNVAFAETPGFRLMCPYDTGALGTDVIEEARRSHPFFHANGDERHSATCRTLEEVSAPFSESLPEPSGRRAWRLFQRKTLRALRSWVAEHATRAGLSSAETGDLVLAAHEIATNSVVHGGGGGICRIWTEGETLVCEFKDSGMIEEPLAGRERPDPREDQGYGLWLANQLCDLVQIRAFGDGGAVRLHKRRG